MTQQRKHNVANLAIIIQLKL